MKPIVIDTTRIRDRAYSRWQEQGCPAGTAEQDWLEAEREIAAQCAGESPAPSAKLRSSAPAGRVTSAAANKEAAQRPKPPRPTLKRAPNARAAKLSNEVGSKGPPESRTQRALAAAAAAHIKRTAIGSS
jgi:hypothetical protein